MSKIVTVAAYKGGVGKTTLAVELAFLLDAPLVDLDWDNGGATRRWGFRPTERSPLLDALEHDRPPRPHKGRGKPDLVPGDRDFEVNQPEPEQLAAALEKWAVAWDRPHVVVDTHPGGGRPRWGRRTPPRWWSPRWCWPPSSWTAWRASSTRPPTTRCW